MIDAGSKILCSTIPNPAHDFEVKVTDLEFLYWSLCLSFYNVCFCEAFDGLIHVWHGDRNWSKSVSQASCPVRRQVLLRYHADKFKMPKFSKGLNSGKIKWFFFFFFLIQSGNLPIIPYQLTKFQDPSSNTFWDILQTTLKYPNFQRAITPEK